MNRKQNNFDFLRLFAALSVIVLHSTEHFETNFLWFSHGDKTWFYDGVLLFFLLSGYLVFKSSEKCIQSGESMMAFYKNRLLRIAPAIYFYLVITIFLLIITSVIDISQIFSIDFIGWFMSTLFFIPVYHPSIYSNFGVGVLNGSLWTIPVEMSFYVILPFILIFKKKKGNNGFLVLITVISVIGLLGGFIFSGESIIEKLYGVSFLPYFCVFALGILLGEYWHKIPKNILLFLLSIIIYYAVFLLDNDILDRFRFIPLSYVVMWFAFEAKPKNIFNKVTKFGDASFGLYIWHMVIVNFFIYFGINKRITGTLLVSVVLILSYIISIISWNFIEKPALKLKKYSLQKFDIELKTD